MSSNGKPLSASLGEALASKSSEVTLLSRPHASEAVLPSPPSSRPSRIANYRAAPAVQLPAPPIGPDRSLVDSGEGGLKRKRRTHVSDDVRAAAVKRALAGEVHKAIAGDIGVSNSTVSGWVREAKAAAERETAKKFEANDIAKLSSELGEALNLQRAAAERVKVLKAKLRVLLGDE